MAIKPILDIDIDPTNKLGAYVAKYKEYEAALKKTPGIWAKAGAEAEGAATSFETGVAALLAMLDAAQQLGDQQRKVKKDSDDIGVSWKTAATWSKNFASNIAGATISLAKWVGIGSAITGIVGAGGLWGLDRLAGAVGAGRRSAQGLGLSYGEQKAFGIDFGRLVDTNQFLGGVSESLSDVTKRRFLYAGGLSNTDIAGKDTAQVSVALLSSIKHLADNTDPRLLGQVLAARGLGQFGLSVEDLRRLRATPESEIGEFLKQYRQDKSAFGFDDATQKKWQDLDRTLEASKTKIEAAFIKGLSGVAPELSHLSDAVADAITIFLGRKSLKEGIKDFAGGIKNFAGYISSPKFLSDMQTFVTDIGLVAQATVNALRFFGLIPAAQVTNTEADVASGTDVTQRNFRGSKPGFFAAHQMNNRLQALGLDPMSAAAVEGNAEWESGLDPNRWGDYDKNGKPEAYGLFQMHKAWRKEFAKWAGHPIFGTSAQEQERFIVYELTQGKAKALGDKMRADKTLAEKVWDFNHDLEAPRDRENRNGSYKGRLALASKTLNHNVKSHVTVKVVVKTPPGSNPTVNASTLSLPQ